MKYISLYLHAHQPYRVRKMDPSDIGSDRDAFNAAEEGDTNNRWIIDKVSEKSYLPTNTKLIELLNRHPEFKVSLSITGTLVEQLRDWRPDVLDTFKELVATGRVDIVAETYYHSLVFFYDRDEFEAQVEAHTKLIEEVFGITPQSFRNTELAYNNELAQWADQKGYKAILAEGWDPVLDWRSPNFAYRAPGTENIKLMLKNYKLSDDIAFRFSNQHWTEWPLSVEKYTHWVNETYHGEIINLFMDYETFGEHQWEDSGIFDFLDHLPAELMKYGNKFVTVTEAAEILEVKDTVDMPYVVTWADTERDLSAWLGNSMQHAAISILYKLKDPVMNSGDPWLIHHWRRLQTSDHYYYMCTKWFNDGDVHAYFSPYNSPYDGHEFFLMAVHDLKYRLMKKGLM